MKINTVSFHKARIYKNKMFFSTFDKKGTYTRVFDNNGNNILNRISTKAIKTTKDDFTVISRKNKYEDQDKNIFYELIERIYDKAGNFVKTIKTFECH